MWEETMSKNAKTLFVMTGAHPVHVKFAESIGAEIYQITHPMSKNQPLFSKIINLALSISALPRGYDIYITESCFYYPAILKFFGLIRGKIINLNSSPLLYWIKVKRIKGLEKTILLELLKKVDGHIFLGKKWHTEFSTLTPNVVAYPFISRKNMDMLVKAKPSLESKNICIIASKDYYYKGLDLLIDAFEIVRKKYPNSTLYVVGQIEVPEKYRHKEGVIFTGKVDCLAEIFNKCSLYVHPARGEVFAVSVLEAMCAGLPVIVSNETGNCEIVDTEFITTIDPEDVSKKIIKYFELSKKKRQELSVSVRKIAQRFSEKKMLQKFKREYRRLLSKI